MSASLVPISSTSKPETLAAAASSPPYLGPTFQCDQCKGPKQFLGVSRAVRMVAVSRSTIYYWMDRGWIHWRLLPSGRRVICLGSLSSSAPAKKGSGV
jgi:predicted DNA-binding transcriptional regulator AlpA